jgi:hypothetical protein
VTNGRLVCSSLEHDDVRDDLVIAALSTYHWRAYQISPKKRCSTLWILGIHDIQTQLRTFPQRTLTLGWASCRGRRFVSKLSQRQRAAERERSGPVRVISSVMSALSLSPTVTKHLTSYAVLSGKSVR